MDSFTAVVTVLPEPVFSFNAPPVTGCNPVTVQFSDSSFADTSVTMVIWNFGDGGTSTQTNPNHVYTQAGTYDVSVIIVTNNPCVGTVSFTVTGMVTVYPAPKAGLSATPTTLTMFDTLVTFTDMSQGATNCWIWYGDGDSSSNCGGTHAYGASGNYTVTQIVENQYGCRDQFELLIDADMDAIFWIPNAFTPNHDGKNEMFMPVAIGIQNFRMWIFDRWGNLIFETIDVNHGWNGTFKGDRCQQDVYVWKCEFEKASKDNTPYKRIGHVSLVH